MRVIFFGTPALAVPTLDALCGHEDLRPLLVVSQPSRPVGRGRRLQAPPVVEAAERHGIEVAQPEKVKAPEFLDRLRALEPDVAVVVAFGQIFTRKLLALPEHGCINVHASLLPKYRGAAPIQAAIANGDAETGVTTMRMTRGLDTGPMLLERRIPIDPDETSAQLGPRLATLGAELLIETLRRLEAGTLEDRPQDAYDASYASRLDKSFGEVDWSRPAAEIYNRWRAVQPWPGLHSTLLDKPVKLTAVRPVPSDGSDGTPGTVLGVVDGSLEVVCGDGTMLGVERLQRPGKRAVSATDFANGERLAEGVVFGDPAS
ncbi:MAG: methionyl-tRNA formyltransferase [Acidobacteriota bacterium]